MMGADLSKLTPHQVVVASPFQLGWKAVAVRSKQLPQGLLGGAAPALDAGEVPDEEDELEEDEEDDGAEADALALDQAEAEAWDDESDDESDDEPAEDPDEACDDEPDEADEPALFLGLL